MSAKQIPPSETAKLTKEYAELTQTLAAVRTNFNYAETDDAIDALIFEENAVLSRLNALYKAAKEQGAVLQPYEFKK